MTGKDLLQAMNYLEDELVETSVQTSHSAQVAELTPIHNHKSKLAKTALKWGAVAAALLVCFGGGVAYAAKYGILRTNPGWESGYQQELLEDIAASDDPENTPAFGWIRDFDTVEETVAFIGHENLTLPAFPGTLEQTGAVVIGNNKADIIYTEAFARYSFENVWATTSCRVYTNAFSYATGAGIKEDGLQYVDETYITATGKESFIVIPTEYAGNHGIQGYLVDDSVIYEIWISCYESNSDRIIRLMKEWLDQF